MARNKQQNDAPANGGNEDETAANGENTFKLNKTKEIADRFRGDHEVRYTLPVAVAGTSVADAIEAFGRGEVPDNILGTLVAVAGRFAPEADFAEVLVGKLSGQGLNLDVQKAIKSYLAPDGPAKELSVEEALEGARKVAEEFRAGAPRAKGTGGSGGKVAKAEAKAAAAANTALDMYRALPAALRAEYRERLVSMGIATVEELDAVDAEG